MGTKLYVGNLSYDINKNDLEQMFAAHGTVTSAQVITDRETPVSYTHLTLPTIYSV